VSKYEHGDTEITEAFLTQWPQWFRGGRSGTQRAKRASASSVDSERNCALTRAKARLRPLRILRDLCVESFLRVLRASVLNCLLFSAVAAQNVDAFSDTHDGGKLHAASAFVCPTKIGAFERDAVGEADPEKHTDFCAYSARDGVYGTIRLVPLSGTYDARTTLAPDFVETESLGGKRVADGLLTLTVKPQPLVLYARTYETTKLQDLRYRVLFAGGQIGNWAMETTIEYADPRDTGIENQFLHAVYAMAEQEIAVK
jgi:hypothetical protein